MVIGLLAITIGFSGLFWLLLFPERREKAVAAPPAAVIAERQHVAIDEQLIVPDVNLRAFQLMDACDGKTDYQASAVTKPLVGQSLSVRGELVAASGHPIFSSATLGLDGHRTRSAFVIFQGEHAALLALHVGDKLTVRGCIKEVTGRSVHLERCELIL